MERGLVLVLMLLAAVVLRLAMQLQVLAVFPLFGMVLVLVLTIWRGDNPAQKPDRAKI
jgi:hypothetical protein